MSKKIIIIPSRLSATRLPNKPLADIAGKPMIYHVAKKAVESGADKVVVATCDEEILQAISSLDVEGIMTSKEHNTGTDRIYEALCKVQNSHEYQFVVNLQGDLPLFSPDAIKGLFKLMEGEKYDIATPVAAMNDYAEVASPNIVKAAVSWHNESQGRALYFSRSVIPHGAEIFWHHVGIYCFARQSLEKFVKLPQTKLELSERLEQLRALEDGMTIGIHKVDYAPPGVDTPEDLEKVRKFFS